MISLPKNEAELRAYIEALREEWHKLVTGQVFSIAPERDELKAMERIEDARRALKMLLRHKKMVAACAA